MNIIDGLLGEHAVLNALFDALEAALAEPGLTPAELRARLAPVATVLEEHARLEDELLFPTLEQRIGPAGPLACMHSEHDEIERRLEALATLRDDDTASIDSLGRELRTLLALVREHFAKEEHVLFQMAGQRIPEAERDELGDLWAARRNVTLPESGRSAA